MKIRIYTDGSSKGNPGPGGWGAIIISSEQPASSIQIKELGGREERTTNNRMEMTAAIESLRSTRENSEIEIYSDSEYLIKGITMWVHSWQKNGWRTKSKDPVLNQDLWETLLLETQKRNVEWKKVAGHSGHELNERCDEIATTMADGNHIDLYEGDESGYKFKE